jgi:two-component system OmpR family sensor kinase
MFHPSSLRTRMMLLFCLVVGVLLAGSDLIFYAFLAREVHSQLDRQILETANPVVADLASDPTEQDVNQLDLPGNYFELLDASGRVLQQSQNLQRGPLAIAGSLPRNQPEFRTLQDHHYGRLRLALVPFERGGELQILALAVPTRAADQSLARFRNVIFWVLPLSLLLMAVISGAYVARSLKPITELTEHAAQMTERIAQSPAGSFWKPLTVRTPHDELGRLAETFNRLFSQVDAAVRQLRQFVTDSSHELRTPLSVLQGEAELMLSRPRQPEEYQQALRTIDEELKKLHRIIEGLFTLSMADAGQLRLDSRPLYLNEVLEEACAVMKSRAEAKQIAIERRLDEEINYRGDEAFLRQLFLIFLDNAVKYSPPQTRVQVSLEKSKGSLFIRFRDQGIGISPEHLPHIFERFYRASPGNGNEAQSGGLGLAIAQAIARAHGGSIECASEPGHGSSFTVILPASP